MHTIIGLKFKTFLCRYEYTTNVYKRLDQLSQKERHQTLQQQ